MIEGADFEQKIKRTISGNYQGDYFCFKIKGIIKETTYFGYL